MAQPTVKRKVESVSVKTLKKWPFHEDFNVVQIGDDGGIEKLECKVCSTHLTDIRKEASRRRIKGAVLSGIQNYATGISLVHKGNIMRHIKSDGLHDWAKRTFNHAQSASSAESDSVFSPVSAVAKTPMIDVVIQKNTHSHYTHLFVTALSLALRENPFSDFQWLIKLQRQNGVMFLSGKDSDKACKEFITYLAESLRSDMKAVLSRSNFISGLMDGSQARKTGVEKELVYAKVVVNGSPVELLLQCQHMPDFGGEDANSVKSAFDKAFLKTYDLPENRYSNVLVSVCADGASVNMGALNGACTQIKRDYNRDWILIIHCSNHRLELAVKDAFKADSAFQEIDEMMMNVYYMFRNSGKAKRLLDIIALNLGVTCVSFVKASGTRFQNHKYRASKAMIVNFLPLCTYAENMIENPAACNRETAAKLKGYIKIFLSYKYLAALHFYRQVLSETAHLSYVMQSRATLITDIMESLSNAKHRLEELQESAVDLPFEATENPDATVSITALATNLPASLAFKDKHKLSEKEKKKMEKLTHVFNQEYKLNYVDRGKEAVRRIKHTLLPAISASIDKRFESFLSDKEIYNAMLITDHTIWDYEDDSFGVDKIKQLGEHFQAPLSFHGFNLDLAVKEFKQVKRLVKQKYRSFKNKISLWETLFHHYGSKYPHILLVIELCLSIAWSSSTVERGFSTKRRILADSRTSLGKSGLNDLLLLRINVPIMTGLDADYEQKLVKKAVESYMTSSKKGRYRKKRQSQPQRMDVDLPDTFLPTPFEYPRNTLLSEDSHIIVSESEGRDSDSSDSDSHESDSEIEAIESEVLENEAIESEVETIENEVD